MSDVERRCPGCQRIYEQADVPDDICPFCEPEMRLQAVGGSTNLIADMFSVELGWPRGQAQVFLMVSRDYMDAQLTKAQLEANGIPVLIEGGGVGHIYMGTLAQYQIFVPADFLQEAQQVLNAR